MISKIIVLPIAEHEHRRNGMPGRLMI